MLIVVEQAKTVVFKMEKLLCTKFMFCTSTIKAFGYGQQQQFCFFDDATALYDTLSHISSAYLLQLSATPVHDMMTSSNGNIFRVTGSCAGNSPVTGEFPSQRPVTQSFDVFFDLRLNKRLSKQSWGWWFETPSHPLWRYCNGTSW